MVVIVTTPAIQRALHVGVSTAAHGPSTSSLVSSFLASLALEKFTITGNAWPIPPTEGIIVGAMVARAKDRVYGEAHRGHEQKENNPLRIHCVPLTFSVSPISDSKC
jgi:hypothetical protein